MTDRRTAVHKFHLPITTEDELREFVRLAFGVVIPDTQVCPHHTTPWRAFADAYFAKYPVTIWKGSRGFGGKSFALSVLGVTEAITLKASSSILGGSGAQSLRVHDHMRDLWGHPNAPKHLLKSAPSSEKTELIWGNRIVALMASQTSVRGPHPQRLRMDEIDEMDLAILEAAQGQPMEGPLKIPTQTVMSSTHQYSNGTMTEMLRRASDKGWPVYEWCYKETSNPIDGWLDPREIERKRHEIVDAMWVTEYDLQTPSPTSRAIMPDAVELMFDPKLGEFQGAPNEYIEIEPPMSKCTECEAIQPTEFGYECLKCGGPTESILYVHGADWARKNDWTIIPTFRADRFPLVCVAWERSGRAEWPYMVKKYEDRIKRYGGGNYHYYSAAHDGTGLGDVIDGYLSVRAHPVIMAGATRTEMLSDYISHCENGKIVYPMIKYAYTEHLYSSVEDVFGGSLTSHLPDSVAGGSLALYAYGLSRRSRLFVAKDRSHAQSKLRR
jgi:hypothetical protein